MPSTYKRHDTWPPIRGVAADENGNVDLTVADSVKFLAKSGSVLIEGTAEVLDPPESGLIDGQSVEFNWKYVLADGDLDTAGDYKVELEVTWDSGTTPPQVETFPSAGTELLTVEEDQG